MKLQTSALKKALSFVQPFTAPGSTLPQLGMVRMSMTGEGLVLEASDIRTYAQSKPISAMGSLDVCVPAQLLRGFCDRAGDEIDLKATDGTVVLKSGKLRASMRSLPGEDFPQQKAGPLTAVAIEGVNLSAMLDSVVQACARNDIRPWANGVLLQAKDGWLHTVATDSGMMMAHSVEHDAGTAQCILHADIVERLPQIELALILDRGVIFHCEGGHIRAQVIDTQFPDWQRITKEKLPNAIHCKTEDFRQALEATKPFQVENKGNFKGKLLRLECDGHDKVRLVGGDEDEGLQAEFEGTGTPATVSFRAAYWHDALKQDLPENLEISFNERGQFAIEHKGWKAVILRVTI